MGNGLSLLKRIWVVAACGALCSFALAREWPAKGKVTGDQLNIRARPGAHYERLGRFRLGETVTVVSETDGWYEVSLPDTVQGWVTDDSVNAEGVTQKANCPLYSGPALVFTVFSKLPEGLKLEIVGEPVDNWHRV